MQAISSRNEHRKMQDSRSFIFCWGETFDTPPYRTQSRLVSSRSFDNGRLPPDTELLGIFPDRAINSQSYSVSVSVVSVISMCVSVGKGLWRHFVLSTFAPEFVDLLRSDRFTRLETETYKSNETNRRTYETQHHRYRSNRPNGYDSCLSCRTDHITQLWS